MTTKRTAILFIVLGTLCAPIDTLWSSAGCKEYTISSINIAYIIEGFGPGVTAHYRIELDNGFYYSNEREIDPDVIQGLSESFTDFYEGTESEGKFEGFDFYPYFFVNVQLIDGKEITLESHTTNRCLIPWNIFCEGAHYVQYNGKIPSALFRILKELGDKCWLPWYDKEARWGCYSHPVPERHRTAGMSDDFPTTAGEPTLEEGKGNQRLLWEVDLQETIIEEPVCADGNVIVKTCSRVIALDMKGEILWEVAFRDPERKSSCSPHFSILGDTAGIVAHQGTVCVSGPDSWVYCVDAQTGDVLWEYDTQYIYNPSLYMFEDFLLVFARGIFCFERNTGEKIWEIPKYTHGARKIYDDTFFFMYEELYQHYYAIADMYSGDIIWEVSSRGIGSLPAYDEGILYYYSFKTEGEDTFYSYDMEHEKTLWSYSCDSLRNARVFEDTILLVVGDELHCVNNLLLLDKGGSLIWEYTCPESNMCRKFHYAEVSDNTIYILLKGGIIQKLNKDTGEKMWEIEVRGKYVMMIEIYKNRIYVSADDGILYCLEVETGKVVWKFDTHKEVTQDFDDATARSSHIGDDLIFVATEEGIVYALYVGM
jgi:hypothetical protein